MQLDEYMALPRERQERYLEGLSAAELLQAGIDLYNARHYWHAHEAWEAVWLDAPREQRSFYQGLIQVTAAFVHLTRSEYPGTVRLLDAGIEKLAAYPASYLGIDLGHLVAGASAARQRVVTLGELRLAEFDRESIPRIDAAAPPV